GAAIEFLGEKGSLYIDRGSYTYREAPQRRGPIPEPVTKRAAKPLEAQHVRNFLDSVKARKTPNSDVVSGHRSALASHLGKLAYVQKKRVVFDPAKEREYVLPNAAAAMKAGS